MSKDTPYADFGMARGVPSLDALEEVLLDEVACLKTVQPRKINMDQHEYTSATRLTCDQAVKMLQS